MKKYIFSLLWLYLLSLAASLISFILSFVAIFHAEFSTLIINLCVFVIILLFAAGGYKSPKYFRTLSLKNTLMLMGIYSLILCVFYFLSTSGIPLIDTISAFSIYFLFTALIFLTDVVTLGLFSIPSFLFLIFCILIVMSSFYVGIILKSAL